VRRLCWLFSVVVSCDGQRETYSLRTCPSSQLSCHSVVRNLLVPALTGPDTSAHGARDSHAQTDGGSDDDESNDDLSPQSLLAGQVLEQVAALRALVCLPLVHDSLSRWPHGALLDAAVDRRLGLLCGGGGQGQAGLDITLERVHVEVDLALGRAAGVHGAAGLGVLVEGRVGVRRVEGRLLLGEIGRGRRHGGLGGGGRAQRGSR
jgi:hypothetical protein